MRHEEPYQSCEFFTESVITEKSQGDQRRGRKAHHEWESW
jgi:hypothetical protein